MDTEHTNSGGGKLVGAKREVYRKMALVVGFFKMCVMYINIYIYIYEIKTINLDFNIFRYLALIL